MWALHMHMHIQHIHVHVVHVWACGWRVSTDLIDGLNAVPLLGLRAERVGQQARARHCRRRARGGDGLVSRAGNPREGRLAGRLELFIRLLGPSLGDRGHLLEVLDSSVRVRRLPTTHFDLRDGVESLGVAGVGKLLLPPCALDLGGTAVDARRVAPLLAQHGIMQGGGGARGTSLHSMASCRGAGERAGPQDHHDNMCCATREVRPRRSSRAAAHSLRPRTDELLIIQVPFAARLCVRVLAPIEIHGAQYCIRDDRSSATSGAPRLERRRDGEV
jgi:hypothetical protein